VVVPTPVAVIVDRLDAAAPSKKSNNSPKPVIGDQSFHSIVFPGMKCPGEDPCVVSVDAMDVLDDWDRAS